MERGVKSTSAEIFSVGYQHMTLSKRTRTPISHIRTTEEVKSQTVQGAWAVFIITEAEYKSSASQLNVYANRLVLSTQKQISLQWVSTVCPL